MPRRRGALAAVRRATRAVVLSVTSVALAMVAVAPVVAEATASTGSFTLSVSAAPSSASPGDTVTYTYVATNSGAASYAATDVQIVDDTCSPVTKTTAGDATFDSGDSWTFACARAVVSSDPNPLVSHAQLQVRATASDPWSPVADSGASVTIAAPTATAAVEPTTTAEPPTTTTAPPPSTVPPQSSAPGNAPKGGPKSTTTTTTTTSTKAGPNAGPKSLAGAAVTNDAPISAFVVSDSDCPFADSETGTECVISATWTAGGGGVAAHNFPAPGLPGPYTFKKTLHITSTGVINAQVSGITLHINGSSEDSGGAGGALLMDSGAVIKANDQPSLNNSAAGNISIDTTGNVIMQAGSQILAQNTFGNFSGGVITIDVNTSGSGAGTKMVLCGPAGTQDAGCGGAMNADGATIDASNIAGTTAPAGSVFITVNQAPIGDVILGGSSGLLDGASVRANTSHGQAGTIEITAGKQIVVEQGAVVESIAGSGDGSHGGPISLISGCLALISGTVQSIGPDPGADLVHIEGCEVHVTSTGVVKSQAPGHTGASGKCADNGHASDSSVCVEIWARHVIIDSGGEVFADFALSGGINGSGWVDIFAEQDIVINGPASGHFAVHSNSAPLPNGNISNDTGGVVTVMAKNSFLSMTGLALQANATTAGSNGGHIVAFAGGNVSLDGSTQEARGGTAPNAGGPEIGGTIENRAFAASSTLTGGPAGAINTDARTDGTVTLTACGGDSYTGTITAATINHDNVCPGPTTPPIPGYVVFNPNNNWNKCGEIKISGTKTNSDTGLPLEGWTIRLYDNSGNLITSDQTGADGGYSFGNLTLAIYKICEVLPDNTWTEVTPNSGGQCNVSPTTDEAPNGYTVDTNQFVGACCSGANITGKDFANHQEEVGPPTKSGHKFNDLNGDGVWDKATEPPIKDWTINLYDENQNSPPLQTTTTNDNGFYQFTLSAGVKYVVCEALQTGWVQTAPPSGTGIVTCTHEGTLGYEVGPLTNGTNETDNDFGNFEKVTKSGVKFDDLNGNGAFDQGEPGIDGWTINLYKFNGSTYDFVTSDDTSSGGGYSFPNLGPGTYRVCEGSTTGYVQTFPNTTADLGFELVINTCPAPNVFGYQFTTQSGNDLGSNDFGNFKKITKSGTKFDDLNGNGAFDQGEPGIDSWTINLYKSPDFVNTFATTATDSNGDYSFPNLGPGTYRVCEGSTTGYVQTFPNTVGGEVVNTCPAPNTFGYQFTTQSGTDLADNDFGNFKTVTKSGTKFNDLDQSHSWDQLNEPGIANWPINLYKSPDFVNTFATTTTDSNGDYSFPNLGPGTYRVCEGSLSGFVQTFPNTTGAFGSETKVNTCPAPNIFGYEFTTHSGTDLADDNFGNFQNATKTGAKFNDLNGDGERQQGEPGIGSWTINLYVLDNGSFVLADTAGTDSNGGYSFGPLDAGTYLVCEASATGWIQTVPNASTPDPTGETINGADCPAGTSKFGYQFDVTSGTVLSGNDFGNFEAITKSGVKWEDVNGNGTRDDGDNPLPDWTIQLYKGNTLVTSVQTGAGGAYSFPNLGPGTYTVCEVIPSGWVQTFPNVSTPDPTGESIADNCAPPSGTHFGYTFTAQSGNDLSGNDFGNHEGSSIRIVKDTQPDSATAFTFDAAGGITPASFVLDDDGNNADTHSNTQVMSNVVEGTPYTVTEPIVAGYSLTAIDCSGGQTSVDLNTRSVQITTAAGDSVVCTFVNQVVQTGGITTNVTPAVTTVTPSASALAFTGSDTGRIFWSATTAIVVGLLLVFLARRRGKREVQP